MFKVCWACLAPRQTPKWLHGALTQNLTILLGSTGGLFRRTLSTKLVGADADRDHMLAFRLRVYVRKPTQSILQARTVIEATCDQHQ